MAEFHKQEIREQQELLEQEESLKRRSVPEDSDSDSCDEGHKFDWDALEALRLPCDFDSRNTTPTSTVEYRLRASPRVIDRVVEKLRYAKMVKKRKTVRTMHDVFDEPLDIPRLKNPQSPAEPSKRRQELDAYRRSTTGTHSINAGIAQPALSQKVEEQVHRWVRTDLPINLGIPLKTKKQPKADIQTHRGPAIDSAVDLSSPARGKEDATVNNKERNTAKVENRYIGRMVKVSKPGELLRFRPEWLCRVARSW